MLCVQCVPVYTNKRYIVVNPLHEQYMHYMEHVHTVRYILLQIERSQIVPFNFLTAAWSHYIIMPPMVLYIKSTYIRESMQYTVTVYT